MLKMMMSFELNNYLPLEHSDLAPSVSYSFNEDNADAEPNTDTTTEYCLRC